MTNPSRKPTTISLALMCVLAVVAIYLIIHDARTKRPILREAIQMAEDASGAEVINHSISRCWLKKCAGRNFEIVLVLADRARTTSSPVLLFGGGGSTVFEEDAKREAAQKAAGDEK